MQIAFCSNFLSAHQKPLCDALYAHEGCSFRFVATEPLSEIRRDMGWKEEGAPYVIATHTSDASYQTAVDFVKNADVVIVGNDDESDFFKIAATNPNTIIFRCCERPYKRGRWRAVSPRGILRRWNSYYKYPKNNLYMLCCSAYAAGDYALLGSYIGHCFKWGYFTAVKNLNIQHVLDQKEGCQILWAGRMLDLKHPEVAIRVAEYLRKRNIPFHMNIAGDGPEKQKLQQLIMQKGLTEQVHLLGMLSQQEISGQMLKSSIFLATSDYNEGWGAVVGEAMSRGCAVVGCEAMGSVPFLIKYGQNGYSYPNGNIQMLCNLTEQLLTDGFLRRNIGQAAYTTMNEVWNPAIAVHRLIHLTKSLKEGNKRAFVDGPCSRAYIFRKGR